MNYYHLLLLFFSLPLFAEQLLDLNAVTEINDNTSNSSSTIPNHQSYEEYFNRGTEALRIGQVDDAIMLLLKAIKANPQVPQPYFNLGIAYETKEDIDKAIEAYKNALARRIDYAKAHNQLAQLLQKKGQVDQAIIHFKQACNFDKQLIEPAIKVARLLVEKERYHEALPYFEQAVNVRPHDIQLTFEYANTLNTANETEKALEIYQQLLKKRPKDSGILYNTAYTLKKLGRIQEAMPYYQETLKLNPHHAEAHFSLGLAYLINGDFKQGWPLYEWRWNRNAQLTPRSFSQPQWDGSSLQGKTILLHAEQGLGDTFQFIRYAKVVKEKYKGTVIVAVQRPVYDIIARCCPYIDKVTTLDQIPAHFDVQAPLMSLPFILDTIEETIPQDFPYIIPDPALVEHWHQKLASDTNIKVGICWQGNSQYSTPFLRAVVAAKSLAAHRFAPLGKIPGITLYSLQRETGIDQLKDIPHDFHLVSFDETFDKQHGRFMDTAAVMKNLDLIITVDTSTAHLAGDLGDVPVWVMLPEPADWRWMLKRLDSPWYPHSMRLFRQQTPGDWDSVIQTIAQELEKFIAQKKHKKTYPDKGAVTSSLVSLKEELATVSNKLNMYCKKLSSHTPSPDNTQFLHTIKSIYHLAQIRKNVQQKIAALEE